MRKRQEVEEPSDGSSILSHYTSLSTHIQKEMTKRPALVVNSKSIHSDFKIIKENRNNSEQSADEEGEESVEEEVSMRSYRKRDNNERRADQRIKIKRAPTESEPYSD